MLIVSLDWWLDFFSNISLGDNPDVFGDNPGTILKFWTMKQFEILISISVHNMDSILYGPCIVPRGQQSKSARLCFILRKPLKTGFKRRRKFDSYKNFKNTQFNKPMVESKSFLELPKSSVEIQIYTSSTNFYNNGKLNNNFIIHLSDQWLARYFRFS